MGGKRKGAAKKKTSQEEGRQEALRRSPEASRGAPSMQRWACRLASVVCLVGGAFLAEPVTQSVADLGPEVRRTLERGEYDKAERLAVEWHSRVQATHGSGSIELVRASDLLVEALLKNGKAAASSTLDRCGARGCRQRARARTRFRRARRLPLQSRETPRPPRRISSRADAVRASARAPARSDVQPDNTQIADTLDAVGATLLQLERFALAQERLDESLQIREQQAAEFPLKLARTLASIGTCISGTADTGTPRPWSSARSISGTGTRQRTPTR